MYHPNHIPFLLTTTLSPSFKSNYYTLVGDTIVNFSTSLTNSIVTENTQPLEKAMLPEALVVQKSFVHGVTLISIMARTAHNEYPLQAPEKIRSAD